MFVVHTVNQLEEAVRVGAEEILVTGGLASNVHAAYLSKSCKNKEDKAPETQVWGISSIILVTGEYVLVDTNLDTQFPSMILQRTTQH